jgi:hypothetical protein
LNLGSTVASAATFTSSISAPTGGTTFMIYPLFPQPFRLTYTGVIAIPQGHSLVVNVRGSLTLLGLLGTRVNISWREAYMHSDFSYLISHTLSPAPPCLAHRCNLQ